MLKRPLRTWSYLVYLFLIVIGSVLVALVFTDVPKSNAQYRSSYNYRYSNSIYANSRYTNSRYTNSGYSNSLLNPVSSFLPFNLPYYYPLSYPLINLNLSLANPLVASSLAYDQSYSIFPVSNPNLPFGTFNSFFNILGSTPFGLPRAEVVLPTTTIPVYYTYAVVNEYPHDRTAFTQGLVYENGFLYEGTGIPGRSTLRKVDLLTGTVLQVVDLDPQYFGEGITIYGNTIIQLTWLHQIGFVYDKYTFALLDDFTYTTQGWGITHDGKRLIMSDGTSTLRFLDPTTFAETGQLDVYDADGPVALLNELEYIKGELYANVWLSDRIARISPVTGQVLGWIDLTGLLSPADIVFPIDVLNGIAYDAKNDRLFVTGKFWPKVFEIDLIPL